jgi:hypothetical protein
MAARSQLRQADFTLADLDLKFADKRTANAYVVITGQVNSETNRFGQPLRMILTKSGGRWLIAQVRSVPNVQ